MGRWCGAFAAPGLPLRTHSNTAQGIAQMQPHISMRARVPTVYVDATRLGDEHLTGIGRYTARVCMALAARGARVRFFADDHQLLPPPGLDWSPDQDLNR